MPIVNLTANFIKHHLLCPAGKLSIEYCAKDLPGFLVEVSAVNPGVGSYRLRHKEKNPSTGKPQTRYKSIGRTYEIDFTDAKKRAKELKSMLALGQSIKSNGKNNEKDSITYSEFFEQHYKPYILQRKRSARADIGKYNHRVKARFGSMELSKLELEHERHSIQQFITDLREEGLAPATCDRYLQMIRYSLRLAVDWGYLARNPADKILLFNVDNRVENYLSDDEMARLMKVLQDPNENRVVCSLILFLLSTGARLMEAQLAKWKHIDLKNRVWRIPATNSKSKRTRSVPLSDISIKALKENHSDHKYVFISPRGNGNPYNNIDKSWYRIRIRAGLKHFRIHDLRHSFASILINKRQSIYTIKNLLGHSTIIMTERYSHLSSRSLKNGSDAAGDAIQAAMDKAASGDG